MVESLEWEGIIAKTGDEIREVLGTDYKDLTLMINAKIIPRQMHAEITCSILKESEDKEETEMIYFYNKGKTQYPKELMEWLNNLAQVKMKQLENIARREYL